MAHSAETQSPPLSPWASSWTATSRPGWSVAPSWIFCTRSRIQVARCSSGVPVAPGVPSESLARCEASATSIIESSASTEAAPAPNDQYSLRSMRVPSAWAKMCCGETIAPSIEKWVRSSAYSALEPSGLTSAQTNARLFATTAASWYVFSRSSLPAGSIRALPSTRSELIAMKRGLPSFFATTNASSSVGCQSITCGPDGAGPGGTPSA